MIEGIVELNMPRKLASPLSLALFCLCTLLAFSACNRTPSQATETKAPAGAKRYSLKGIVVSVDKPAAKANINNEPIAGFMDQMVMPYSIQPPAALDQLQPGDSITADVVVDPNKYWLENVKVTAHAPTPAKPADK
jgi:Cu/Ag efflux protein CusF